MENGTREVATLVYREQRLKKGSDVSKIAKMTLYVTQTKNTQTISVRTVGKRGTVTLNTLNPDIQTPSQSPSPDALTFWKDVLAKVTAGL